jgi:excisionase family DNA binding protein
MTDQIPRLAPTPEESGPDETDVLDLVVRMPISAAFVDAVARRLADLRAHDRPAVTGGRYLTVKDAAQRLGVHENTVRRAINDGRLAAAHVGKRGAWRIEPNALDQFVEASRLERSEPTPKRARRQRKPIEAASSFSARARVRNQVEPRPRTSTKEAP